LISELAAPAGIHTKYSIRWMVFTGRLIFAGRPFTAGGFGAFRPGRGFTG